MSCQHQGKLSEIEIMKNAVQCEECWDLLDKTTGEPAWEECLNFHPDACRGGVAFHSIDPGRQAAFPRCDFHWEQRLDSREHSIEKYADSSVAPAWFDPGYAGERWDEE